MWWVISNQNQWYVGNHGEMVPSIQHARVFNDRAEAVAEATSLSTKTDRALSVILLSEAAYLDAKGSHKTNRRDKRSRKAPCEFLPFAGVFMVNPDGDSDWLGFHQMRSLYLAVRGAEVVGVIGEANGQVISLCGTDYEILTGEYSVVPTCPACGEPVEADSDDEDDDGEPFDPADFR